jgi:UDP-3-O-[3-hydroxymyristoyl] glucosamine N-acyltransferase
MEFKAKQIARILDGEIVGDPDAVIDKLSKIEEGEIRSLSFLSNPKYTPYIYTTKASVVIVNADFEPDKEVKATLIKVEDSYQSFAQLLNYVESLRLGKEGIEQPCFISKTAQMGEAPYIGAMSYVGENVKIGNNVKIFPNSYLGDNVTIGDNTVIYAGVKIYHDCIIGSNCTLHAGVVVGSDGFGFAPRESKDYQKIAQIGNVQIEDFVEIGANTCVDRATIGSTIIRKGAKLDNLIQVAHNVEIGENTVIAAQSGVAGSAKLGANCMLGGQVAIAGHITLGDNVKVGAKSGVTNSVKDNGVVMGFFAFDHKKFQRSFVYFRQLPELVDRLKELENKEGDK